MIQIIDDNFGTPRVLRVKSGSKTEVFVRQTRDGLILRPEKVTRVSKDKVLDLAQGYFDKYPDVRGPLPFSGECSEDLPQSLVASA